MTEREATIQSRTDEYVQSLPERRAQEENEPYYHYSKRQYHYSEYNKKSISNYMWQKWGIK